MTKTMVIFFIIVVLCTAAITLIFVSIPAPSIDVVMINDIIMSEMQDDSSPGLLSKMISRLEEESQQITAAARNREYTIRILIYINLALVTGFGLYMYIYFNKTIIKPFKRLQKFAKDVALGNLEIPLEMDKGGSFGAFTESFDLMRIELKKARENERAADRSKKELVASLSHDIKTPVASIKATTELMLVTSQNEKDKERLRQIEQKAEQINSLITDMFHATMQELEELSVEPVEIHSTALSVMIKDADYKRHTNEFNIPECIIIADPQRLQQIFDNIIGNSYKYADTLINVEAYINGDHLIVKISDSGPGALDDDLPLLAGKYYRGKNAKDKSGYGLGLYICTYLISKMSGEIDFHNEKSGFTVDLRLRLAGA